MRVSAISASRIKTYKNCEMSYFLNYHIALPEMRKASIYTAKGSAVHEVLELWVNAKLGIEGDKSELDYKKTLLNYYKESKLWMLDIRTVEKGGDPYPQEKNCAICPHMTKDNVCTIAAIPSSLVDGCPRLNFEFDLGLITSTINSDEFKILRTDENGKFVYKILAAEQPFDMVIGGVPTRGVIDLVVELDPKTVEIVDYKTGRSMSYNAARKDPQVLMYGKAVSMLFPQYSNIMITLWFLKKRPVSVNITPEMNELTVRSMEKNYQTIISNEDPKQNGGWLCKYCIGWTECVKVKKAFSRNRKFILPVISCRCSNTKDEPCWGSLRVENPDEATLAEITKIKYVCKGHKELQDGGEYTPENTDEADEKTK